MVLIIGNAPIETLPKGAYDIVFYFSNNSRLVGSMKSNKVFGVIQDFTIDEHHWKCDEWGAIRKRKYTEFLRFYRPNYEVILMNSGLNLDLKSLRSFKIDNYINHTNVLNLLLTHLGLVTILKVVKLKGLLQYILLVTGVRKKIPGKYRPSSGFVILLNAITKYPNHEIHMIGFSEPGSLYLVTEKRVLDRSPHYKLDSLIYNKFKNKIKFIV